MAKYIDLLYFAKEICINAGKKLLWDLLKYHYLDQFQINNVTAILSLF